MDSGISAAESIRRGSTQPYRRLVRLKAPKLPQTGPATKAWPQTVLGMLAQRAPCLWHTQLRLERGQAPRPKDPGAEKPRTFSLPQHFSYCCLIRHSQEPTKLPPEWRWFVCLAKSIPSGSTRVGLWLWSRQRFLGEPSP